MRFARADGGIKRACLSRVMQKSFTANGMITFPLNIFAFGVCQSGKRPRRPTNSSSSMSTWTWKVDFKGWSLPGTNVTSDVTSDKLFRSAACIYSKTTQANRIRRQLKQCFKTFFWLNGYFPHQRAAVQIPSFLFKYFEPFHAANIVLHLFENWIKRS